MDRNRSDDPPTADKVDNYETLRLTVVARKKKRNRVSFFNFSDGVTLRLKVHLHVQSFIKELKHCVICGCREKHRRTKFMCVTCHAHLCVRTPKTSAILVR